MNLSVPIQESATLHVNAGHDSFVWAIINNSTGDDDCDDDVEAEVAIYGVESDVSDVLQRLSRVNTESKRWIARAMFAERSELDWEKI